MVPDEQIIYARWLGWGTRLGLAVLIGSFLAYAFALIEPFVPVEALPQLWSLPVDRYLALSGAPSGWGWISLLHKGDYANFPGIAGLALITLVCYARLVPTLWRSSERLQAGLAIAQVFVLLAAASGLFAGGH
jgi:hypothetical protein